jgi:hypothetical protein
MSKLPRDYKIGFGRPPNHTKFKKGKSGNLKGRPKGSTNLKASVFKELMAPTKLQEGNRTKTVPRIVGICAVLLGKAAAGDSKLAFAFLELALRLEAEISLEKEATPKAPTDEMPPRERLAILLRQIDGRLRSDPQAAQLLPGQETFRP